MSSSKERVEFYTTLGCHLCEQAMEIITMTLNPEFFEIVSLDIADDDDLMEKYGVTIPVIKRCDTGQELNWPFDQQDLVTIFS